jgi:hypothetical protein
MHCLASPVFPETPLRDSKIVRKAKNDSAKFSQFRGSFENRFQKIMFVISKIV